MSPLDGIDGDPENLHKSGTLDDNTSTYKGLVEKGYDQIAVKYLEWTTSNPSPRTGYLEKLLKHLSQHSKVLELGCGAGFPTTQLLAAQFEVTANDISASQLLLAKQHAPNAKLIYSDMMSLSFPTSTFDAVVAFYSIIHLPREEQVLLMTRISNWLSPGGYFLLNLGTEDNPGSVNQDWLGSKMYWSGFDEETNREMVKHGGFEFLDSEVIVEVEDGNPVPFLWILAQKPSN